MSLVATYYNPVQVYYGVGTLASLAEIVQASGKQILMLTGARSLKASGYLDKILQQLQSFEVFVQDNIPSNPDVADILHLKKATGNLAYDVILAVGGGSVIDAAKALAAFRNLNFQDVNEVRAVIQNKSYAVNSSICPVIAVPSTAGTGSEVTPWATIWDQEAEQKYSIEAPAIFPKAAIVDPVLTQKLSSTMTASSALDALGHAVEAYWSKNSNEIVRLYACEAISKITRNLNLLLENPSDLSLRTEITYGSLYAGLAFSNTKTTACHSISYPLTLQFGISHGVAVSMTLGAMLVKNEAALIEKEKLLAALGIKHTSELTAWIHAVYDQAGLPKRLRDYGVTETDLPVIADKSYTPGRMDNNPVEVDKSFLVSLLEAIY